MQVRTMALFVAPLLWIGSALAQQCCTGNVSTYCTAGTSVQGCVPAIEGVGRPRVDAVDGFNVRIASLPGGRYGTFFYGFASASQPWTQLSSSLLCVAPPVQRTGVQDGMGTVGLCDGLLQQDFNEWLYAHPTGLGSPFVAGQMFRIQGWYRDPGAPGQTNLSDALVFSLCTGDADFTPPSFISCASNQTVPAGANCTAAIPDFTATAVAVDNCTQVAITQSPVAGGLIGVGSFPITLTATDSWGNTAHCTASLTVIDVTSPVIISCAPNQSVPAGSNCQGVVPDFTAYVVAVDACGGPVSVSQVPSAGTMAYFGINSVTLTATDSAGNTSQCSAQLAVTLSTQCQNPPGFAAIQPSIFMMGEVGVAEPVHQVSITYPYWMATTEVTQEQYTSLMGTNPSQFQGNPLRPVEQVTWNDARAYCISLTAQQAALGLVPVGYEYRLPTEAEWELGCRAGTATSWNVGNSLSCIQSNHNQCVGQTTAVGTYASNLWGLFDMHGNVREWCLDSLSGYVSGSAVDPFVNGGASRVFRGGSWFFGSFSARSAYRSGLDPNTSSDGLGFRVVLAPAICLAQPPFIVTCASDLVVPADASCQASVPDLTPSVTAYGDCGSSISISQWPVPGSMVGLGVTAVRITVSDQFGRSAYCDANLTVSTSAYCQLPTMIAIAPGDFVMGESGVATPVHQVTISYPFKIGATEVSQAEFAAFMGYNPSGFQGDPRLPVDQVSWFEARAFCSALTAHQAALGLVPSGQEYRLPTEAEWEYACRAGSTSSWNVGGSLLCTQANHKASTFCLGQTAIVGSYGANAWGMYDTHGNVSEWCLDTLNPYGSAAVLDPFSSGPPTAYRVIRGGSWAFNAFGCRSAFRNSTDPSLTSNGVGFRVVLGPILVP